MKCSGSSALLKRALPFLGALAVGLFITSFFVDLRPGRFSRGWRGHRHQEIKRLQAENDQLRAENERLHALMESGSILRMDHPGDMDIDVDIDVPPPPMPPVAPVAPHVHR